MMFAVMLLLALKDSFVGVTGCYCLDGNLFNFRRMQATANIQLHFLCKLLIDNDCSLSANSLNLKKCTVDLFAAASSNYSLNLSTSKIEVL